MLKILPIISSMASTSQKITHLPSFIHRSLATYIITIPILFFLSSCSGIDTLRNMDLRYIAT